MLDSVIPKIKDWPINLIALKKDKIMQASIADTLIEFNKAYPTNSKIRELIQKTLYLERIRIKTDSWEVDPEDENEFWAKIKKQLFVADPSLIEEHKSQELHQEMLHEIVSRYTHEICGNFKPGVFWMARQVLRRIFARLFNAHFGGFKGLFYPDEKLKDKLIVAGPVDKIRNLVTKGTVILVPTHFSNLDSVIIGFGMDYIGLPAFQYGAGLNLFNSKMFNLLMSNLGPYKLDRRKKNPIYVETLKSYSKTNVIAGANTIFFPGGTRSRAGNIENDLKLGLLGTVMEAQREHYFTNPSTLATKIFVVPLTISYPFVLEASSLIEEHLKRTGKEQYLTQENNMPPWKTVWKFFWETFSKSSEITLSLGEPMDVFGNNLDDDGFSLDKLDRKIDVRQYFMNKGMMKVDAQRESIYTQMLGDKIVAAFKYNNVVYASHVVAFVAFELLRKQLDSDFDSFKTNMKRAIDELYMLNNRKQLKLASHITTKELPEIIDLGIEQMSMYHPNLPLLRTKNGNITSEDLKLLYYYHNRMDGYGLQKYIG